MSREDTTHTNGNGVAGAGGAELLDSFLQRYPSTKIIACQVITYGNANCTRFVTVSRAHALTRGDRLRVSNIIQRLSTNAGGFRMDDMVLEDDIWVPDWTTLRPCVTKPQQATVQCDVLEMAQPETERHLRDPRAVLRLVEQRANALGLTIKVGIEVECYFMDRYDSDKLVDTPFNLLHDSGSNRTPLRDIIYEAIVAFEEAGVAVYGFNTEGVKGKWEMSFQPTNALLAADNAVWVHETIKEIAYKHGYHATFHPNAIPEEHTTAGQHIHFSINGPTALEQSDHFLAGLVAHLPAAAAFLLGGYDSYTDARRFWTGGGIAGWSRGKWTPIRRFEPNHFEARLGDCLGNTYLQLAVLIATGLHGIQAQLPLTTRSLDVQGLHEGAPMKEVVERAGITQWIPKTLTEALDVLEADKEKPDGVTSALSKELVEAYIGFKRDEVRVDGSLSFRDRRLRVVRQI